MVRIKIIIFVLVEVGKKYIITGDAPTGMRGKIITITKITKRTVWFDCDMGHTYFYHSEFNAWVQELTSWSGNKLKFKFV